MKVNNDKNKNFNDLKINLKEYDTLSWDQVTRIYFCVCSIYTKLEIYYYYYYYCAHKFTHIMGKDPR